VRVGDTWHWGDVVLQVTKPREPCYKLDLVHGKGAARFMRTSGFCGWYLRVLREGVASTSSAIEVTTPGNGPSIQEVFTRAVRANPTIPGLEDD